ncbi:MAG: metallophosphoesterase [Thermodesulfovibrio sp.]|nr:metallophosphoesterase [Thermodesulfovibrio sp.]
MSIFLVIYGYFEAQNIKIERVVIKSDKIIKNIKIAQISDVHIGLLIREKRVKAIVDKINEIKPDILVSTGDLVDGQIDKLDTIAEILKVLAPPQGKYAITGNHEFYAGLKQSLAFIEKSGFIVLRNEGIYLENLNLSIVGVDDPESKRFGYSDISESELLKKFKNTSFILLLKHRPIIDLNSQGLFDLQLSGHTHKGQLFPFSIITAFYYAKQAGCIKNSDNCYLYISRGTGTWGPPVRIFAKPEITIIEIVKD